MVCNSTDAAQIPIAEGTNVDDLCEAIKLKLKRFSNVDADQIVIKREGVKLARNLLIQEIDASTPNIALHFEIVIEKQNIDELVEAVEGLNSALSSSEWPSPVFGLGTHALSINLIKTGKEMDDHFKETRYWTYPGKLSSDATFGKYTNLPRGGRVEQMH